MVEGIHRRSEIMRVAVIDGQGGGIGRSLIKCIKKRFGDKLEIIALGTNYGATSAMLREGADRGASGENAIAVTASNVDIIVGPLGIIMTNSMLGEITMAMTSAISNSSAKKILIPINMCNVIIAGTEDYKLSALIENALDRIQEEVNYNKNQ